MSVAESLRMVLTRLTQLSVETKHPPASLIAVSKTTSPARILQAYEAGQRAFGENYVAELVEKAPLLPPDIQWHFIGHLQSNKVKTLVDGCPNLACVQGLESAKLAQKLDAAWTSAKRERRLKVLVQVNTSFETSKEGVDPEECRELVRFVLEKCPSLKLEGLMTIGRLGDTTSACFDALRETRDKLFVPQESSDGKAISLEGLPSPDEFVLSMGMSGDFETAVRSGSNSVRVGSLIFGARPPKVAATDEKSDVKEEVKMTTDEKKT
jgi:pyridoxal phosphate enzyme (YggS family)